MLTLLLACTASTPTDDSVADLSFTYPLDDVLRVNHVQALGTHNSYHQQPADDTLDEWIDGELLVFHAPLIDAKTSCERLVDCLGELRAWSDRNPAHHPMMVLIEPKTEFYEDQGEDQYALLEADLASTWPDRVITPAQVQGDHDSVREGLAADGWPTLGETRGGVVFSLLDTGEHGDFYTHGESDLDGRRMFSNGGPEDDWAGFILLDDPWDDRIPEAAAQNLLIRTRVDSGLEYTEGRLEQALASGAHALSSDLVDPEGEHVTRIPEGTPSRCNPVTAPPECTSEAIEDPAFVFREI